jgi:hypothetical protein
MSRLSSMGSADRFPRGWMFSAGSHAVRGPGFLSCLSDTTAIAGSLPADEQASPGHSGPDGGHEDQISGSDSALVGRFGKREWY